MKIFAGLFLLTFLNSLALADSAKDFSLEETPLSDTIMLSNGAHTLHLPVAFMNGARVVASGYSVLIDKERHFSVETHTKASWNNPEIAMNDVPRMLVEQDFSSVADEGLRRELQGIHKVLIENTKPNEIDVIHHKNRAAYLVFSPQDSVVLVVDKDKPDAFTQISVYGLNRKEIEDHIIKGVMQ